MRVNSQLLREIADAILEESDSFHMKDWGYEVLPIDDPSTSAQVPIIERLERCDTSMCIGGWAVHIEMSKRAGEGLKKFYGLHSFSEMASYLIFGEDVAYRDRWLFFVLDWPLVYQQAMDKVYYGSGCNSKIPAKITADLLYHLADSPEDFSNFSKVTYRSRKEPK